MQKPMLDKQDMIRFLGDVIEAEMDKPEDEIDMELIAECDAYLAELLADIEISDEQMTANIAKIKGKACHTKAPETRTRRMPRPRRLIAAILAAVLLIGGTLTAYAFVPAFRDMVRCVLNLGKGSSMDDGGVTYTYAGETVTYQSIDDLIAKENLNILYPHDLPSELKIKYVLNSSIGDNLSYTIGFFDGKTAIDISFVEVNVSDLSPKAELFVSSRNITSYILDRKNMVVSTTIYNGWTYYITTTSMDLLKIILENLY